MIKLKTALSVSAIAVGLATGAMAEDVVAPGSDGFTKYGEVEGWNVYVDIERKSCLIENVDAAANVVQMGLTADHSVGYLGVFSKNEAGVRKGQKEEVIISIDGNVYSSKATGMKGNITEGYSGGYILANNPAFISDLAKKYTMTVFPETEAAFVVDLTGTYKAMEMGRKCNAEQM